MGRIFHGHRRVSFSLVVVNQFNVKSIFLVKTENDAPVGPHRHGPEAPQIAFERMQPVAGEIERLRGGGSIETAKNVLHGFQQIGAYSAAIAPFVKPFQAAMLKAPNHQGTVKQRLPFVKCCFTARREPIRGRRAQRRMVLQASLYLSAPTLENANQPPLSSVVRRLTTALGTT